jgi:hypothetical protein
MYTLLTEQLMSSSIATLSGVGRGGGAACQGKGRKLGFRWWDEGMIIVETGDGRLDSCSL